MNRNYCRFLLISFNLILSFSVIAQSNEDFTGPFPSWADVKKRFGAKGDGLSDDTKAIQDALDHLANFENNTNTEINPYSVIYFPAGTYLISQTLQLKGKIGVMVIGADPNTTILKWNGAANDTMFLANGSAYFKVSRFTWLANQRKGVEALGVHWLSKWREKNTRSYATLNIELSDMIFKGGFAIGIGGGTFYDKGGTGSNDSEIMIKRCSFSKCTDAGIKIQGFNALDYWIWYCRFVDCNYGIYCGNGNYHAYSCTFRSSTGADFYNKGGYYTSVRDSYSNGSKCFSKDEGSSCNPFKRVFQNNVVLNCTEVPIEYYHLGNVTLLDNVFKTTSEKTKLSEVKLGSWCPGFYSILSLNNKYSFKVPIGISMPRQKLIRFSDSLLPVTKTNFTQPDTNNFITPGSTVRKVFEVPVKADAAIIQDIINKAAVLKGTRPIVHFPVGKFYISKSIEVPAGSDMLICGDGLIYASQIIVVEIKNGGFPVFVINGPSKTTVADLHLVFNSRNQEQSSAIVYKNIDKAGSRLIIDQLYSSASVSLSLEELDNLYVEKNNSFFSYGNTISGGSLQKAGKGSFKVVFNGGQFTGLTVKNNAKLIAKDVWWEGQERVPLNITGDGSITIDAGMIAPGGVDSAATIKINDFKGKISLMNMYIQGAIEVKEKNPDLSLLCWNLHFYYKKNPIDLVTKNSTFTGLFSGFSTQCFDNKDPWCKNINTFEPINHGVQNEDKFLALMTNDVRKSRPTQSPKVLQTGASNVFVSRICVGTAAKAIRVIND